MRVRSWLPGMMYSFLMRFVVRKTLSFTFEQAADSRCVDGQCARIHVIEAQELEVMVRSCHSLEHPRCHARVRKSSMPRRSWSAAIHRSADG